MWLSRLDLLAFGHFSNVRLDLGPGFHLVYGPNEAGKSTTLRAIRQLLFGFDERTTDNFVHKNPNLRVGGIVCNGSGADLQIIRRKTRKESLRSADDVTVIDDAEWQKLLCGIDESTFSSRYGINYDQLVKGGREIATGSGDLGQILFATASGIKDLSAVQKSFVDEAGELFRQKGEKQRINAALNELKKQKEQVTERLVLVTEWEESDRQRQESQAQLDATARQLERILAERDQLESWRLAWPHIQEQQSVKLQLAQFGPLPRLPDNFSAMRQEAASLFEQSNSIQRNAALELAQAKARLEQIELPQALLAGADELTRLLTDWGSYSKAQLDRQGLVEQLDSLNATSAKLRESLGRPIDESSNKSLAIDRHQRAKVGQMGRQQAGLAQSLEQARQHRLRLRQKTEDGEIELKSIPLAQPMDDLKNVVRQARADGDLEERHQRLAEETRAMHVDVDRQLGQLGLWTGPMDRLITMNVPPAELIADFERRFDDNQSEPRVLRARLMELEDRHKKLASQIEIAYGQFQIPMENELREARKRRDDIWAELSEILSSGNRPTPDLIESFKRSMILADQIADRLRSEADRVAQLAEQLSDKASNENDQHEISLRLAELKAVRIDIEKRWQAAWPELKVAPLAPREMQMWLARRESLLQRATLLRNREDEAASIAEQIKRHVDALNLHTGNAAIPAVPDVNEIRLRGDAVSEPALNESPDRDSGKQKSFAWEVDGSEVETSTSASHSLPTSGDAEGLDDRLNQLEQMLELNDAHGKQRVDAEERLASLKREELELASLVEKLTLEMQTWQDAWRGAMLELSLPPDTSADAASQYMDTLSELAEEVREIEQLKGRITGIDKDASQFRLKVETLCQQLAPELVGSPTDDAVKSLRDQLSSSQRDRATLKEQTAKKENAEKQIVLAIEAQTRGKEILVQLFQVAGLEAKIIESTDSVAVFFQTLNQTEERSRQRDALEDRLLRTNERLQGLARETPVAEFISQVQYQALDKIAERLRQVETEIPALVERKKSLIERTAEIQAELKGIDGRADAAEAAEKQQITLAQIRSDAEQYVRARLAGAILQSAIEKYREKNRGPVLTAASALFRELTLQCFEGLRVDEDERGNPVLVGVRSNSNEAVNVEGMSDGTCDQLYLALRLASLQTESAPRNQLPFIVDDILIQFDDQRASAALGILAKLGRQRQVIFFTHHEHLLEIANKHLPGAFSLHRLEAQLARVISPK